MVSDLNSLAQKNIPKLKRSSGSVSQKWPGTGGDGPLLWMHRFYRGTTKTAEAKILQGSKDCIFLQASKDLPKTQYDPALAIGKRCKNFQADLKKTYWESNPTVKSQDFSMHTC